MAVSLCVECQARPRRTPHANTKYCEPCHQQLLRIPRSRVSPAQDELIRQLRNTMPRARIAERVGISHARLDRYLVEAVGLTSNARDYPPEIVMAVCTTYAALGKRRTQDLFPDVVVRSIIERHRDYAPRQLRWSGEHQIEAVRMGGAGLADGASAVFQSAQCLRGLHQKVLGARGGLCAARCARPGASRGLAFDQAQVSPPSSCRRPGSQARAPSSCRAASLCRLSRDGAFAQTARNDRAL